MKRLAWVLALAFCAVRAEEEPEIRMLRAQVEVAQMRLLQEQLMRSARGPAAASDAESAWLTALRAAMLSHVGSWDAPALLSMQSPGSALWPAALQWGLGDGLNLSLDSPIEGPIPAWLADAIRRRVATQQLPARTVEYPPVAGRWRAGRRYDGDLGIDWADAAVWSGPAVRDHAASYVQEAGTTRIRVAIGDGGELWQMALARGVAARLVLDDAGRALPWNERLPLRLELKLPVWLVTPQELIPATLTGLHQGDTCRGGGWTELRIDGQRRPPVWALLFLPDEATARAAIVKRLPTPAPDENNPTSAQAVGRLEVSWPDARLPALTLVAKRFGDMWGSYAELSQQPADDRRRLSAAGSPECAVR